MIDGVLSSDLLSSESILQFENMIAEYKHICRIQANKSNICVTVECKRNSRKQVNGLNAVIITESRQMSQMQVYQLNGGVIGEYRRSSRLQMNNPFIQNVLQNVPFTLKVTYGPNISNGTNTLQGEWGHKISDSMEHLMSYGTIGPTRAWCLTRRMVLRDA